MEAYELGVVTNVGEAELLGHTGEGIMEGLNDSLWLGRHQPTVNADGQVLQQTLVLADLGLEGGVGDARLVVRGSILIQGSCQLLHRLLIKTHPILIHASSHHMLELGLLDQSIACNTTQ